MPFKCEFVTSDQIVSRKCLICGNPTEPRPSKPGPQIFVILISPSLQLRRPTLHRPHPVAPQFEILAKTLEGR